MTKNVIDDIVEGSEIDEQTLVVEIKPKVLFTTELIDAAGYVIAIELMISYPYLCALELYYTITLKLYMNGGARKTKLRLAVPSCHGRR